MKRAGNLIGQIADTDNLYLAFYKSALGKRLTGEVIAYQGDLDRNIQRLGRQILDGDLPVGNYRYFKVYEPKERQICAASFPERVLHHALMNVCHPYFERHLIFDTYATRIGKGSYAAIDRAQAAMPRYRYVAKLDVRKYFDSISHAVLKTKLRRLFKDQALLSVFDQIIDSYSSSVDCGLPIGNLTSQYFANFYLSFPDHYVKETLCVPVYIRYMDDMLLFGNDRSALLSQIESVRQFMKTELHLELKPAVFHKTVHEIDFCGYKILNCHKMLNKRSRSRFRQKLSELNEHYIAGKIDEQEFERIARVRFAFERHAGIKI